MHANMSHLKLTGFESGTESGTNVKRRLAKINELCQARAGPQPIPARLWTQSDGSCGSKLGFSAG